jgi:hypothetical protein
VTVEGNFVRKGSNDAKKVPISGARVIMLPKTPVQAKCNLLDAQCVWLNLSQVNVAGDAVLTTGADGTVLAYSSVADPTGWAIYIDLHGAVPVGADAAAINQGTEQIAVANTDCALNKRFTTILVADGSNTAAMTSRQQQFKGSLLEITYPDSVVWDGTAFSYPFIFTSDSDWEVDICGDVPQGYRIVSDKCVQLFVANETKVIFFDVIDFQSPEPNLKLHGHVKHNGKTKQFDADVPGLRKAKGRMPSSRISETASETEQLTTSSVPTTYVLHDAYPNPFNPTATILYDIPQGGYVKLKIYNVIGREVAVLVDEYQEVGQYAVRFKADGLPSGVYLCRMTTGRFTQVKRLVLTK